MQAFISTDVDLNYVVAIDTSPNNSGLRSNRLLAGGRITEKEMPITFFDRLALSDSKNGALHRFSTHLGDSKRCAQAALFQMRSLRDEISLCKFFAA